MPASHSLSLSLHRMHGTLRSPLLMNTDIAKVAKSLARPLGPVPCGKCGWLDNPLALTLGPRKNGQSRSVSWKRKKVLCCHTAHGHPSYDVVWDMFDVIGPPSM